MNVNSPTLEEWRRLYQVMDQVKALAPWQWMVEDQVFGVQDPESGELGFVSVMGVLGEHVAVVTLLGAGALYDFWDLHFAGPKAKPERLFEIPQLQASFEDRQQLEARDIEIIKSLGLKYRGRQSWPLFRAYTPGYLPWFLQASEARFLTHILEQVLQVAPRVREDESLLTPTKDQKDYLVRVPRKEAQGYVWEDQVIAVLPPEPEIIDLYMDMQDFEAARKLPPSRLRLEADLVLLPTPIRDAKEERPYFPYMLLVVESEGGFVVGTELLKPMPTLREMWGYVPALMVQVFLHAGAIPAEVRVNSDLMKVLLDSLGESLGFNVKKASRLRKLDLVKNMLLEHLA